MKLKGNYFSMANVSFSRDSCRSNQIDQIEKQMIPQILRKQSNQFFFYLLENLIKLN